MASAADSLHSYGDGARCADLADEVDITDVYSELQRCCRYKNFDFAVLEALLGVETKGAGERAVVCGDVLGADAAGEFEGDFFDEAAGVDEDEGGAVVLRVGGEFVEDLFPHAGVGDGAELVAGDFDGDVELAALAYLDDGGRFAVFVNAGEKVGDEFDWVLRSGETDSLRRHGEAGQELAGAEAIFAGNKGIEAF